MSNTKHTARAWVPYFALVLLSVAAAYPLLSAAGTDTFAYDELGQLKKVTYANGTITTYTLDPAGNRTAINTGGGGGAPTYIAITNSSGTILPSAAALYTVASSCSSNPYYTLCTWQVSKLYGDRGLVARVSHEPRGIDPGCYSGTHVQITTGYVRSGCALSALSTVYGQ